MVLRYEAASWSTNQTGCMAGAIALGQALAAHFPTLLVNKGIYGCFNDRAIVGSDVPSLHREGRALDVGVPQAERGDRGAGWRAACALAGSATRLGVQLELWDRHTFRAYGPAPWHWQAMREGTAPHVDHIHVEMRWNGARTLTARHATAVLGDWLAAHPPPGG